MWGIVGRTSVQIPSYFDLAIYGHHPVRWTTVPSYVRSVEGQCGVFVWIALHKNCSGLGRESGQAMRQVALIPFWRYQLSHTPSPSQHAIGDSTSLVYAGRSGMPVGSMQRFKKDMPDAAQSV